MSTEAIDHAADSESSASANEPGQLLYELERRQDDVLAQLDELDARLSQVLEGLGVGPDGLGSE